MVDVGAIAVFPFVAPATGDAAQGAEVEVGDTHGSLLAWCHHYTRWHPFVNPFIPGRAGGAWYNTDRHAH